MNQKKIHTRIKKTQLHALHVKQQKLQQQH